MKKQRLSEGFDRYVATQRKRITKLTLAFDAADKRAQRAGRITRAAEKAELAANRKYDRADDRLSAARERAAIRIANSKGIPYDEAAELLGFRGSWRK